MGEVLWSPLERIGLRGFGTVTGQVISGSLGPVEKHPLSSNEASAFACPIVRSFFYRLAAMAS